MGTKINTLCPKCRGLGKIMREGSVFECPTCLGKGRVPAIEIKTLQGQSIGTIPTYEAEDGIP